MFVCFQGAENKQNISWNIKFWNQYMVLHRCCLKNLLQSVSIPKSLKSPSFHFTQFSILEADALWRTFTFSRFSRSFSEKFFSFMSIKDFLLRSAIALLWCFHPCSSLPDHLMTLHTCVFVCLVSFCVGKTPSKLSALTMFMCGTMSSIT